MCKIREKNEDNKTYLLEIFNKPISSFCLRVHEVPIFTERNTISLQGQTTCCGCVVREKIKLVIIGVGPRTGYGERQDDY